MKPVKDCTGMISQASPEFQEKMSDWVAKWMARLEREGVPVKKDDKGA